jgi:hypothetical protein
MSLIPRYASGQVTVPAALLADIDWVLDMDTAAPRSQVVAFMADVAAVKTTGKDPAREQGLIDRALTDPVHDWLNPAETSAVQKLRGWHRAKRGTVVVDAGLLAEVRNIFDGLAVEFDSCESYLDLLEPDEPIYPVVKAAVDTGTCCYCCSWCKYVVMRDRIDRFLDRAGLYGGSQYESHRPQCDDDPELTWTETVTAPLEKLLADLAA